MDLLSWAKQKHKVEATMKISFQKFMTHIIPQNRIGQNWETNKMDRKFYVRLVVWE